MFKFLRDKHMNCMWSSEQQLYFNTWIKHCLLSKYSGFSFDERVNNMTNSNKIYLAIFLQMHELAV